MVKLSVIIVNYNVQYFLEQCLLSVQRAVRNIDAEIIVVDNNSGDRSCELVKNKFPEVLLIENKANVGFAKANNLGVAKASGEYILILNPDTVVAEDTFERVIKYAESLSDMGAVGVKMIDGTGKFLPESKRNLPKPKVALNKIIGNASRYYAGQLGENKNGEVPILVGAFMLMKRLTYQRVGGFDEDYFMYGEDIDLSYKFLKEGLQNYYNGETRIIHYKGESTRKDVDYLGHFHKAMDIFYKKHFRSNLWYDLFIYVGIQFSYLFYFFKLKKATILANKKFRCLYIGDDKNVFNAITRNVTSCEMLPADEIKRLELVMETKNIDQIIFDNSYLSNKKIIKIIQQLKNKNKSFRIIPRNTHFYLGSDSADSRGEVIEFVD